MKITQKLQWAFTFLVASTFLATSLVLTLPPKAALALNEQQCINKYDYLPDPQKVTLNQPEYEQFQEENCEVPDGPCLAVPINGAYNVTACTPLPDESNDLSRQACIKKYDGELNPSEGRLQRLERDGCNKANDGPCEAKTLSVGKIIDCRNKFENDFCKKYGGREKDTCIMGYIGGSRACNDLNGKEKDACEDGAANGLEKGFDDPDDSGNTDATCEIGSGSALSWFMCGVLRMMDGALEFLDKSVQSLLFVDSDIYNSESVRASWAAMRNLALLILVPMMMLMVIGTALEFGPFDAYTVKKALPRMFVAVLFIVLSLPITQFGVDLSNAAGNGLGNLIKSVTPAEHRVDDLSDILVGDDSSAFGLAALAGGGAAAAVGGALVGGGLLGVLASFGLVAVVALLIGFAILVLRQVLLLMLLVVAPLAILAWIFPGNDKLWGIWKGTFIAMLMMYPLIALLIASGKFVAGLAVF